MYAITTRIFLKLVMKFGKIWKVFLNYQNIFSTNCITILTTVYIKNTVNSLNTVGKIEHLESIIFNSASMIPKLNYFSFQKYLGSLFKIRSFKTSNFQKMRWFKCLNFRYFLREVKWFNFSYNLCFLSVKFQTISN